MSNKRRGIIVCGVFADRAAPQRGRWDSILIDVVGCSDAGRVDQVSQGRFSEIKYCWISVFWMTYVTKGAVTPFVFYIRHIQH